MPSSLLDLLSHVIVDFHVEDIRDEVERILVVLDLGVEAGKVEAVRQVVLVYLAEVLVASGGDELKQKLARFSRVSSQAREHVV